MRDPDKITKRLFARYTRWKDSEAKKDEDRLDLFEYFDNHLASSSLAQKTVEVPEWYQDDIDEFLAKYYPEWDLISQKGTQLILGENPRFKTASYVNKELGVEFTRSVRKGSVVLDDEALREADPELWEEITEEVRVPKELEDLTPEQLTRVQTFLYRTPPRANLLKPKPVKDDE